MQVMSTENRPSNTDTARSYCWPGKISSRHSPQRRGLRVRCVVLLSKSQCPSGSTQMQESLGGAAGAKTTPSKTTPSKTAPTGAAPRETMAAAVASGADRTYLPMEERHRQNFDCLEILEWELLRDHLKALHRGETVRVPVYDYRVHNRSAEVRAVAPAARRSPSPGAGPVTR